MGVDFNVPTSWARDSLTFLIACTNQNVDIDGFYFENKDRWETSDGITGLMPAAQKNLTDLVTAILGKDADPNVKSTSEGWTAILLAATNGHDDIISTQIQTSRTVLR